MKSIIKFLSIIKVKIIDAAKIAIKNRIRDKETMQDFVLKKREMFLFQMMINCKR